MKEMSRLLPDLRGMLKVEQAEFIFDSMLEGNTTSIVYTDDIEKPHVSLAWDRGHCFYFSGDAENREAYNEVLQHFISVFLNEKIQKEIGLAKLYYPTEKWEESLLQTLEAYEPIVGWRSLYRHDLQKLECPSAAREDISVRLIDEELIRSSYLKNIDSMFSEIKSMWGSTESFCKTGFGYCALVEESIAGWCTAEYVSKNACGIGIETVEEYQGAGIAGLTAAAFLHRCKEERITPHWDSWKRNIPSVRIAEKLGFDKVMDYKVLLLQFTE